MATPPICSIDGCGNGGKMRRGLCGLHYSRIKRHGDPLYVVPKELRNYEHNSRPRKHFFEEGWLRNEYITKHRRNQDICDEIGCSIPTLLANLRKFGIPIRDDRGGAVHPSRAVTFDLAEAKRLYVDELWNCNRIANVLGGSGDNIRRGLRANGVKIRHHNDTKRGRPNGRMIVLDPAVVAAEYEKEGVTVKALAKSFKVSTVIIRRTLLSAGIKIEFKNRVGISNPNWRHDLTPEERLARRDSATQVKWRMEVFRRDGFTCQRCGDDTGHNLNAHHIEAHCENRKQRSDPDNGITLCVSCHKGFHRSYGLRGFGGPELSEYLATFQKVAA